MSHHTQHNFNIQTGDLPATLASLFCTLLHSKDLFLHSASTTHSHCHTKLKPSCISSKLNPCLILLVHLLKCPMKTTFHLPWDLQSLDPILPLQIPLFFLSSLDFILKVIITSLLEPSTFFQGLFLSNSIVPELKKLPSPYQKYFPHKFKVTKCALSLN